MKDLKIAWVLLVVLIVFLGLITFIKFTYKPEMLPNSVENNEINDSITLSEIVNNYNNSKLLESLNINSKASIVDNTLSINVDEESYVFSYENAVLNTNITLTDTTNMDMINNMYVILVDSFSIAQGNRENSSVLTTYKVINDKNYNSNVISYTNNNNVLNLSINTNIELQMYELVNAEDNIQDINNSNYDINGDNIILSNLNMEYIDNALRMKLYISNGNNDTLIIKFYDKDKKEISSTEEKITNNINELSITLPANVKYENISYYSIEFKEV